MLRAAVAGHAGLFPIAGRIGCCCCCSCLSLAITSDVLFRFCSQGIVEVSITFALPETRSEDVDVDHVLISHHALQADLWIVDAPSSAVRTYETGKEAFWSLLELKGRHQTALG